MVSAFQPYYTSAKHSITHARSTYGKVLAHHLRNLRARVREFRRLIVSQHACSGLADRNAQTRLRRVLLLSGDADLGLDDQQRAALMCKLVQDRYGEDRDPLKSDVYWRHKELTNHAN